MWNFIMRSLEWLAKKLGILKPRRWNTPIAEVKDRIEPTPVIEAEPVEPAVYKTLAPRDDLPKHDELVRNGTRYSSERRLYEWNTHVSKHTKKVPLINVLRALNLKWFEEDGMLWIERIDMVGNVYQNFEHEPYHNILIPTPVDWSRIRDYKPKNMAMSTALGHLDNVYKYDVHMRHIAPKSAIAALSKR